MGRKPNRIVWGARGDMGEQSRNVYAALPTNLAVSKTESGIAAKHGSFVLLLF